VSEQAPPRAPRRAHWLDRLAAPLVARGPRFFCDGWGSFSLLERLTRAPQGFGIPELAQGVALRPSRREGALVLQEGRFESPAAVGPLPVACHQAHFQLVLPAGAGERPPVCVLLAANGDEGYGRRRVLAAALARRGLGSVLLENAYYGQRRPPGQQGAAVRTVADFLLMCRATALEAAALVGWLLARGHPQAGLSGYSMGGSVAAYTAALFPLPVPVAPLAAADSAAPVFTEGVLSVLPDWEALGRELGGVEAARRRLKEVLDSTSATSVAPLSQPRRAVLVAARADGFVPPSSTLRLLQHWRGAELRYVAGGHLSAFLTGLPAMADAVRDAFARAPQLPPAEAAS
jgi:hypothetical protein